MEIVVEIGNMHEGSLGVAKSFVNMARNVGIKTVKFQLHLAEAEGTSQEPFRVKFSDQDETRQEYWRRVNFAPEHWINLARYCDSVGVEFLCTVLSVEAATFLYENNLVKRWKVGSGNAVDWPLLEYLVATDLPLLISTGLISDLEISELKKFLIKHNASGRSTLLHCVSKYPVSIDELDLHLIRDLQVGEFAAGFSDHSGSIYPAMYALTLGASVIEVHMTPRKDYFGPDVSSSLLPEEIKQLVSFVDALKIMTKSNGSKSLHYERVLELRKIFRKGLYWKSNFPKDTVVRPEHFSYLKPAIGIDVVHYYEVMGRTIVRDVSLGEPVSWSDFLN